MKDRAWKPFTTDEVEQGLSDTYECIILNQLLSKSHPEKNPIKRLRLFERHTRALLRQMANMALLNRMLMTMVMEEDRPNSGQPWDADEDLALVDWRSDGMSLDRIAKELGRTSQACATRLSCLTGVPRSQILQAFIDGTLDDVKVRGLFQGQVKKVTA